LRTIGAAFTGRDNRFTLIRLALASAVLLEHAVIVTQGPLPPPPMAINAWSISYAAVNGFFVLSGFLIANSLEHRADPFTYAASRILRLMPALVFLSAIAVFFVGPVATGLSQAAYWTAPQTWTYPFQVLAFLDTSQGPAGIFPDHPWRGEFSATLWTLRYEVIAYIAAALLFFTPLPWGRVAALVYFAIANLAYLLIQTTWPEAPALFTSAARLSAAFTLGMVVYLWRERLPVLPWAAIAALPLWLFLGEAPLAELFLNLAIGSLLFWVAFARFGGAPTWSAVPDWSYGIYIWHYPIMQLVLLAEPEADPWTVGAFTIPATAAIAAISWYWIEKPSLGQKSLLGALLREPRTIFKLMHRIR
jgi:peptidoglycan/LPS O-acetylase OafA/YrhL